jgi:acyl-coenzyme A thioesterase PaaI-like protein
VPAGFEPVDLGKGFTNQLGCIYVDRATARMGMWAVNELGNPVDTLHGGAMATFLDCQLVPLRGDALKGTNHRPTISLSIDYMAPVPIGSWVEAQVSLSRETRSMVFTQTIVTVEGRAVARSSAIYSNTTQEPRS